MLCGIGRRFVFHSESDIGCVSINLSQMSYAKPASIHTPQRIGDSRHTNKKSSIAASPPPLHRIYFCSRSFYFHCSGETIGIVLRCVRPPILSFRHFWYWWIRGHSALGVCTILPTTTKLKNKHRCTDSITDIESKKKKKTHLFYGQIDIPKQFCWFLYPQIPLVRYLIACETAAPEINLKLMIMFWV